MKCPNLRCLHTLEGAPDSCSNCGLPLVGARLGEKFSLERIDSVTQTSVTYAASEGVGLPAKVRILLSRRGQEQRVAVAGRELEDVRELGSSGMPRILGASTDGPLPWIATEEMKWQSLEKAMQRQGRPFSEKELVGILTESGKILAPLHDRGLAHRGIRTETISFRDTGGRIGLPLPAWEADLDERPADVIRSSYLAPEYVTGHATARSDIYSLGVATLRLATGLQGPELTAAARNPGARKDHFGLTQGFFDVLCGMLEEAPAKRISSAGQLLEILGKVDLTASGGHGGGAGDGTALSKAAGSAASAAYGSPAPVELATSGQGAVAGAGTSGGQGYAGSETDLEIRSQNDKPEDRDAKRGLGLLALLLSLFALMRRSAGTVAQAATNRAAAAKILLALGLGGVVVGTLGTYAVKRIVASPVPSDTLPTPVVGQDDTGGAVQLGENARALGDLKARIDKVAALPSASPPVGPPSSGPGAGASPPGPAAPTPRPAASETPAGPYDEVAEPGTDPEDASGLKKPTKFFIRVNKTYKTLTLYHDGRYATQYIVAIGKGANSPDGRYTVKKKLANPGYENIKPGDPRNPLGTRWLGMDIRFPGGRSIGIHGTNDDSSIGQAASGGCIRMKNADVEQLFDLVPEGTPVEIN
jgi:lipoprotein-anchoring transpeptidase ErfK/SrfK